MTRLSQTSREALKSIPIYRNIGFEFGQGWFELIYDLGRKITDYCNDNNYELPTPRQIKEKFGTLRFYCTIPEDPDELIRGWIRHAEEQSEYLCEECGEAGETLSDGGRIYTTCNTHRKEGSLTMEEYKVENEKRYRAQRTCEICGVSHADIYWDGKVITNRCDKHKEDFITDKEYFKQRSFNV